MKIILYPMICSALLLLAFFIEGMTPQRAPSATDHLSIGPKETVLSSVELPRDFDDVDLPAFNCKTVYPTPEFIEDSVGGSGYPTGSCDSLIVNFTDSVTVICASSYRISRSWDIVDKCSGDTILHEQILLVLDKQAPQGSCPKPQQVVLGTSQKDSMGCNVMVTLPQVVFFDDCSSAEEMSVRLEVFFEGNSVFTMEHTGPGGPYQPLLPVDQDYTAIYTISDGCGNSNQCELPITVKDLELPVALCKPNMEVGGTDSISFFNAQFFDNGSFDNCSDITIQVRRGLYTGNTNWVAHPCNRPGDLTFGPQVKFYCCDVEHPIPLDIELLVTDADGNESRCRTRIMVKDLVAPVIWCPADITVACGEDYQPARPDTISLCVQPNLSINPAFPHIYSVPIKDTVLPNNIMITDLDVYLDIPHALVNQLRIGLISPTGMHRILMEENSCSHPNPGNMWDIKVTLNDDVYNINVFNSTGIKVQAPFTCTTTPPSIGSFNQGQMSSYNRQLTKFTKEKLNTFSKIMPCMAVEATNVDFTQNRMNGLQVSTFINEHGFTPGQRVLLAYESSEGEPIQGLTTGGLYYFEIVSAESMELLDHTGHNMEGVSPGSVHRFCITRDWLLVVEDTKPLAGGSIQEVCLHIAYEFPKDILAQASDNLEECKLEIVSQDLGNPSNCPEGVPVNRRWTATDKSGNMSSCIQQIFFADASPFTVQFPCPVTVDCEGAGDTEIAGDVLHTQTCGLIDTKYTDDTLSTMDACFMIHRTWEVRNWCIYQNDGATDYTISSIDIADGLLIFDASITPIITSRKIEPGDRLTLRYHAADPTPLEGMSVGDIYSLIYVDNTTFRLDYNSSAQEEVSLGGVADGEHLFRYANSPLGLPRSCDVLPILCPETPWQTTCCDPQDILAWEDDGDGYFSYVQVLTVENIPTWSLCQDTVYCFYGDECEIDYIELTGPALFSCSEAQDIAYSYEIDINNDGTTNITGSNQNASGTYPFGTHRITFTAVEPCGKSYECSRLFTIQDCEKPTVNCLPFKEVEFIAGSGGWFVTLWPQDLESINSEDNCTVYDDLTFRIERLDQIGPGQEVPGIDALEHIMLTCDDVDLSIDPLIDVVLWAADEAGNWGRCTTSIWISNQDDCHPDLLFSIQVNIENPKGFDLGIAYVELVGAKDTIATALDGIAYFHNLDASGPYTVTPFRESIPLNNVSTYDLLLMQKHIIGQKKLSNPYLLIAADINKDCKITISDMIELRKMILTPGLGFSKNTSWRFVDADYVFTNPLKPCIFPERIHYPFLYSILHHANFIGIKIGDLKGETTLQGDAETRQASGELLFTTSDRQFEAGEELEVVIRASDFEDIQGYQYTLDFDPEVLELVALTPVWSALDANHFGDSRASQGQILTSWIDVNGVTLPDGEALYTLRFRTKAVGRLSQHLRMSDRSLRAEAYAADETLLDVQLRYEGQVSNQSAFQLYPNQPNPVGETTTIGFRLPEACRATLSIYSVTGQMVYQVSGHYPGGYSAIVIQRADLPQDGVLFYELQTPTHRATKRMVVAE